VANPVTIAFNTDCMMIPLSQLLPLRKVTDAIRATDKYLAIKASLQEIGLIEPLVVFPQKGGANQYLLLDGAIRWDILKSAGETEVLCLKATEDESFTYNHKVSQVAPIQEHFMILRAIERGVSEERIAATLNVDVAAIRRKRELLNGICAEAVSLLKDRRVSPAALREMKRVDAMRQIEMSELMVASNNYSASYAKCLYAATADGQKLASEKPEDDRNMSSEDGARMQREMEKLRRDYKLVQETHSENVLNLVPTVGYLRSLLANSRVDRYLRSHYPDIHTEFQKIVDAPELSGNTTN